jgi:ABC-type enterobactin transport system permease subunit
VVQVAFAMVLELPCLEAGLAVDQPPLGVIVRQHRLVASTVFVCVKQPTPPTLCVGGVGFVVNLAPCYLARTLWSKYCCRSGS